MSGEYNPAPSLLELMTGVKGPEHNEFTPHVFTHEDLRFTTMILEDSPTVWHPWRATASMGHAVDLGYHMETGKLVAIRIWDDVGSIPAAAK